MQFRLRRVEATVAWLMTAAALWLHVMAFRYTGGLWRDEANTVALSSLPDMRDVWGNLEYDSFPLLWVLLVRGVVLVAGPLNDPAFRLVGLAVGLSVLGALWFLAKSFGHRYPLVSLALFALAPNVVRWGDSFRAYGLGIALMLITCVAVWRFVEISNTHRFAIAAIAATLSVQTLYYNAVSVFAFCVAGAVVALIQQDRQKALGVISIGGIAAISLLPYALPIARASTWNSLVRIPDYDLSWFMLNFSATIGAPGAWAVAVWLGAFALAVYAGFRETLSSSRPHLGRELHYRAVYGVTILVVGTISMFAFLRTLSYLTQPWYYLTLVALWATAFEILSGALVNTTLARTIRWLAAAVVAVATVNPALEVVTARMTNVDLVASTLSATAKNGDLIVVRPWYVGVTFDRYYNGQAQWMTIPSLAFHKFHRYDLVQIEMERPDQSKPAETVINAVNRVLQSGGTVFVIGSLEGTASEPVILPPAKIPEEGWKSDRYERMWATMLLSHIHEHAGETELIAADTSNATSDYETASMLRATGWKR